MKEEEKLLEELRTKLDCIRAIHLGKKYLLVWIKVKWFSLNPEELVGMLDLIDSKGFKLIGEIGIDGDKYVFRRSEK